MTKALDESGFAKPESNSFKFGKSGDAIKGVLTDVRDFDGKFGQTKIFTVEAIEGFFHDVSEDGVVADAATELKAGESYYFFGKNTFTDDLLKAKLGQQIIVKFVEERKSKANGKKYKYIEAMLGKMDENYGTPVAAEVPFE